MDNNGPNLTLKEGDHFKIIEHAFFDAALLGEELRNIVQDGNQSTFFQNLCLQFELNENSSATKHLLHGFNHSNGKDIETTKMTYLTWEPIIFKKNGEESLKACRRFQRDICRFYPLGVDMNHTNWEGVIPTKLQPFLNEIRKRYPANFIFVKELISFGSDNKPNHQQAFHHDATSSDTFTILLGLNPDGHCCIAVPKEEEEEEDVKTIGLGQLFLWDGYFVHAGGTYRTVNRRLFVFIIDQDDYPIYDVQVVF